MALPYSSHFQDGSGALGFWSLLNILICFCSFSLWTPAPLGYMLSPFFWGLLYCKEESQFSAFFPHFLFLAPSPYKIHHLLLLSPCAFCICWQPLIPAYLSNLFQRGLDSVKRNDDKRRLNESNYQTKPKRWGSVAVTGNAYVGCPEGTIS